MNRGIVPSLSHKEAVVRENSMRKTFFKSGGGCCVWMVFICS